MNNTWLWITAGLHQEKLFAVEVYPFLPLKVTAMINTTTENYFLEKQSAWGFSKNSPATSSTQIFLPNVGPDTQHEAVPPDSSLNLDSSELKLFKRKKMNNNGLYLI